MDGFNDRREQSPRSGVPLSSDFPERREHPVRPDRPERPDRFERSPRSSRPGLRLEDISSELDRCNEKQLEILSDYLEDVKDEVYASEQNIVRAINSTRQIPPRPAQPATLDPVTRDELLKAIYGNTSLLTNLSDRFNAREAEEKAEKAEKAALEAAKAAEAEKAALEAAEAEKAAKAAEAEKAAETATETVPPLMLQKEGEDPLAVPDDPETIRLKSVLNEYFNKLEEHVHRENVKCYRNVQAVLNEQTTLLMQEYKKNRILDRVFVIVTMVASLGNLVVLLLRILGYL